MPTDIQNPRVTRALVDFFTIKGRFLPRLDEVVVPVAIAANLSEQDDEATPGATAFFFVPASAGNAGKAVLLNGLTGAPGVELLLDRVRIVNSGTASLFSLRYTTNAPAAPIAGSNLVKRFKRLPAATAADPVPPGNQFADDGAITGDDMWTCIVGVSGAGSGGNVVIDLGGVVLEPFAGFAIVKANVNEAFRVTIDYRVRSVAP